MRRHPEECDSIVQSHHLISLNWQTQHPFPSLPMPIQRVSSGQWKWPDGGTGRTGGTRGTVGRKGETDEGAGTEEGWTSWSQEHISKGKGRVVGVDSSLHITLESVSRRCEALKKTRELTCGDLCLLLPPEMCLCSWATYGWRSGQSWQRKRT